MPHDGIPVNTRRGLGPGLRETRKDIPATQLFITMRGKKLLLAKLSTQQMDGLLWQIVDPSSFSLFNMGEMRWPKDLSESGKNMNFNKSNWNREWRTRISINSSDLQAES